MKTDEYVCKFCGSIEMTMKDSGPHTGLFCSECRRWHKWLSNAEITAIRGKTVQKEGKPGHMSTHYTCLDEKDVWKDCNGSDNIVCDIPLGKLCCFKRIGKPGIFFGHMAGKVVDDFETMSFMYILKCDGRYFFAKQCIQKPFDVHTSEDAKKYFDKMENGEVDLPW